MCFYILQKEQQELLFNALFVSDFQSKLAVVVAAKSVDRPVIAQQHSVLQTTSHLRHFHLVTSHNHLTSPGGTPFNFM